ncbi:hypothetical protein BT63DRAFT_55100 [Microthyrium microscopicum]|uniref:MATH and UCH domain protein n=1 Tax=Microthyrium microscopicum TaxID=703497 RepID=A0A6A6U1W1_9PEZI|nr:hypothetical protein BT63DRAFT_55100 [Microthyrium microscopicum]
MDDAEPMDLAMSSILPPQNPTTTTDQPTQTTPPPASNQHDDDWVDDDAMDTTPDGSPGPAPQEHSTSPSSPPAQAPAEIQTNGQATQPVASQDGSTPSSGENADEGEDATSSEDEDYDDEYDEEWHEITEDMSVPTEQELKELKDEISAKDDPHFMKLLTQSLDDPQVQPGEFGKIDWLIDRYNGTRENPNKELLMRSPVTRVGGYDWQLKLYPRGNDTEYLSVYVECVSVSNKEKMKEKEKEKEKTGAKSKSRRGSKKETHPKTQISIPAVTNQHTPLPLLDPKPIPKRPSIAASVIVVVYNPDEPRVHHQRSCLHRFCPNSSDWGWTRFYGPYYEIGTRQRGQRTALLRGDKLAVTGFIQLIEDETDGKYEHQSRENPWDSFSMCGLQSMISERLPQSTVPALSAWLLAKPFREFLYRTPTPDPDYDHHGKPMPMVSGLKLLLAQLRTPVPIEPESNYRTPVDMDPIRVALEWYGIEEILLKCDVIELWEVIRAQLKEELKDTPFEKELDLLFGTERSRTTDKAHYSVLVKDAGTMQNAIDQSPDLIPEDCEPPRILHIELNRQHFNEKTRTWQKLSDKVTLDDHVDVNGQSYTLYGFITHDRDLQSCLFSTIVRPNGPGTGWYQYNDRKNLYDTREERLVQRLTNKEAIEAHEGGKPKKTDDPEPNVAYIAIYFADFLGEDAFNSSEPHWDPAWISHYLPTAYDSETGSPILTAAKEAELDKIQAPIKLEVLAIHSKAFLRWQGPGIIDIYDDGPNNKADMIKFMVDETASATDVRDKIAKHVPDIKDARQVKLWPFDPRDGVQFSPVLARDDTSSKHPFGIINPLTRDPSQKSSQRWVWYTLLDDSQLETMKKEEEDRKKKIAEAKAAAEAAAVAAAMTPPPTAAPAQPPQTNEDTVMSDGDEAPTHVIAHLIPAPPHNAGASSSSRTPNSSVPPPPSTFGIGGLIPPAPSGFPVHVSGSLDLTPVLGSGMHLDLGLDRGWKDFMQINPENPEIYFFLKTWDPYEQKLTAIGSFFAKHKDRVDHIIYKALRVHKDPPLSIWVEKAIWSAETIRRRKTFADMGLRTGCIIIVQPKPFADEDEASQTIFEAGGFPDLKSYLRRFAKDAAFPTRRDSAATYTLSYLGTERYVGPLLHHEPHGYGSRLYFSGHQYEGMLHLGKRHGQGRMTFSNGDVYDGSWARDEHSGQGTYTEAASKNVYEGGWLNGRRHGEGVTRWQRAEEGDKICRVCWEEVADAALNDCGHVVACIACARRVDVCPVCRRKVLSALKLWYVN